MFSLKMLADLENLDPVTLTCYDKQTPQERKVHEAVRRTIERRVEGIKQRCDFFEIMRNRDVLGEE